jgi:hypothetical protein
MQNHPKEPKSAQFKSGNPKSAKGANMNPGCVLVRIPRNTSMSAHPRPTAPLGNVFNRSGRTLLGLRTSPSRIFPALAITLFKLAAANSHAQGTGRRYQPASVYAGPDLQCKLSSPETQKDEPLSVVTDHDGYARFFAVRKTSDDKVKTLALNCTDGQGKTSSVPVDLTADDTFAPRPVNLENEPGKDRPALQGDPLAYTQAQLLQLGYGLRPDPIKDAAAYGRWLEAASVNGRQLEAKRPDLHEHSVESITANPWSGSAMTGKPDYVATDATFNVPEALPGGDGTTTTEVAIWNGLGGFFTGSGLIQGGVSLYTNPSAAAYGSWREYCCGDPDSNGYGGAFVPNPGDRIYSLEWYCDSAGGLNLNGGYGCTFLEDETTGAILMTVGQAAEFIIENQSPQVSSTSTAFTDFTPAVSMDGSAYTTATGSYSQTISKDPTVYPLLDFTHTTSHMRIGLGTTDQTYFDVEPFQQSYPIFCHGPLSTSKGGVPLTKFKWASVGADTKAPGPGECVWPDRGPEGLEIKSGDSNYLWGWLNQVASLPKGKYAEIDVYRDPWVNNDLVVTGIVGFVAPPF